MPLLHGRIDRRTFIIGNALAIAVLGVISAVFLIPLAVLDIVFNGSKASVVFKPIYYIFLIPAAIFCMYFFVLAVRRAHDFGYPGVPILLLFFGLQVGARLSDFWILNVASFLILFALCIVPGNKLRNQFGGRPPRRFKLSSLRLDT